MDEREKEGDEITNKSKNARRPVPVLSESEKRLFEKLPPMSLEELDRGLARWSGKLSVGWDKSPVGSCVAKL
ncbi:hypothetical protein AWB71_05248 [Caballeronia peredens]|nr:hypothetical protein AWB71_05248 [Caballeronia peredens]